MLANRQPNLEPVLSHLHGTTSPIGWSKMNYSGTYFHNEGPDASFNYVDPTGPSSGRVIPGHSQSLRGSASHIDPNQQISPTDPTAFQSRQAQHVQTLGAHFSAPQSSMSLYQSSFGGGLDSTPPPTAGVPSESMEFERSALSSSRQSMDRSIPFKWTDFGVVPGRERTNASSQVASSKRGSMEVTNSAAGSVHSDDDESPHERRKKQNRVAQRAFRERKERQRRILEDEVSSLQGSISKLQAEHAVKDTERDKAMARLEHYIQTLRVQIKELGHDPRNLEDGTQDSPALQALFGSGVDLSQSPSTLQAALRNMSHAAVGYGGAVQSGTTSADDTEIRRRHSLMAECGGMPVMPKTENLNEDTSPWLKHQRAWALVTQDPLVRAHKVSLHEVWQQIQPLGRCGVDGGGPMFHEADIVRVLQDTARGGGDDLLS